VAAPHCATLFLRRSDDRPARENSDERQSDDDLHQYNRHYEQWTAGEVVLGARDGRRQKRQVSQVADDDEREQTSAAPVEAPAEDSVNELDDESGEGAASYRPSPNFGYDRPGQSTMSRPWVRRSRIRWDTIPIPTARPSDARRKPFSMTRQAARAATNAVPTECE